MMPILLSNADFTRKKTQFWIDEGVAAVLDAGRGDGGTVFVQSPQGVSREPTGAPQPPQVTLAIEHYGRIYRTLEKKIPVTLQMDIDNKFYDQDLTAFNMLAEIPGTDKADEVVMLGAHFDSLHSGTGATDNAAGSAVMMDVYERVQPQDMMRNAVIVAAFVYDAANRDEKLPRKPLPKPAPANGRSTSSPE